MPRAACPGGRRQREAIQHPGPHAPETSRHAGHADILREQLDGAVGTDEEDMAEERHDPAFWAERREEIEAAARSAS